MRGSVPRHEAPAKSEAATTCDDREFVLEREQLRVDLGPVLVAEIGSYSIGRDNLEPRVPKRTGQRLVVEGADLFDEFLDLTQLARSQPSMDEPSIGPACRPTVVIDADERSE
jgi:hypothetical protein